MIIPHKQEPQEIAINHSSDNNFKDFVIFQKKFTAKPYSFLVNETTLASDNLSCFRRDLLETRQKLTITITDKIRVKKTTI